MATNKTDANDTDGLANLAEVGFFREVRVEGFGSMLASTLVAAGTGMVHMTTELSNQIIDEPRESHQVASYRALAGTHFRTTDLKMGLWGDQQKQLTGLAVFSWQFEAHTIAQENPSSYTWWRCRRNLVSI